MSIEQQSWDMVSNVFRAVKNNRLYRAADERFSGAVRGMVMYRHEVTEMGLAHYTSWENLLKMFRTQDGECPVLRMYNYEMVNDPEEGKVMPPEWRELNAEVNDLLEKYDPGSDESRSGNTYACSFSTKEQGVEDDLTFWRLYGGNGNGVSLRLGTVQERMYRIRYRDEDRDKDQRDDEEVAEDRQVAEKLKKLIGLGVSMVSETPQEYRIEMGKSVAKALRQVLDGYLYLVKSRAYEQEKEWRMIQVRPDRVNVKYDVSGDGLVRRYVEGGKLRDLFRSASVITLGPRVRNSRAARDYVEFLARTHRMKYTSVRVSMQKYR